MKIIYTRHAQEKFNHPSVVKFNIKRIDIKKSILHPEYYTESDEFDVKIVIRKLNENYDLRIIYTSLNGIITIITFYPTRRGRYEKQ